MLILIGNAFEGVDSFAAFVEDEVNYGYVIPEEDQDCAIVALKELFLKVFEEQVVLLADVEVQDDQPFLVVFVPETTFIFF